MEYLGDLYNLILSLGSDVISPKTYDRLKSSVITLQKPDADYASLSDKYMSIIDLQAILDIAIGDLSKSYNSSDVAMKDKLSKYTDLLVADRNNILLMMETIINEGQPFTISEGIGREFGIIFKNDILVHDTEFEKIKNDILVDPTLLPDAPNKKHSFIQLTLINRFTPIYPSQTLTDIAKQFFYLNTNITEPKQLAGALKVGYLLINKITLDAKEYNLWRLIDRQYIQSNGLSYFKEEGVNPVNIRRLNIVTEYTNDHVNIELEHDIKDNNIVLDTFDGKTYRLLGVAGEIFVKGDYLRRLLDPNTSTPKSLECYNRLIESEYMLQDPVDIMQAKQLDWRGIIDQLSSDIKRYLTTYVGKNEVNAKLLIEAIKQYEFRIKIRDGIAKYIHSKDINIKEVNITMENELNETIEQLIKYLSAEFKSARGIYKEHNPIDNLMYRVINVLKTIFNNNNNLFTAIHQKYLVCTAFRQ